MLRKIIVASALVLFAFGAVNLTGCAFKPYKVDVQQGNVLDQSDVKKIHIGMKKEQVTDILGTPVLSDSLESDNWEYVYTNQVNGGVITRKHVDLKFSRNRLTEIKTS